MPSMKVILHIGLPKTGTTFLQSALYHNRGTLARRGILYPVTGTAATPELHDGVHVRGQCMSHNWLAMALLPLRWPEFDATVQNAMPGLWDALDAELASSRAHVAIISSESFCWNLPAEEHLFAIRDRLAHHDVTIVYTERQPHDFITSMYGELLRGGRGPYSLDDFLREFPHLWDTGFQRERWSAVFGQDRFVTLDYASLGGLDMVQRFLAAVLPGHPATRLPLAAPADARIYRSLSPRCLRFMEELQANQVADHLKRSLAELCASLPETFTRLNDRLVSPEDIDAALARIGMSLSPDGHRPEPDQCDACIRPETASGREDSADGLAADVHRPANSRCPSSTTPNVTEA